MTRLHLVVEAQGENGPIDIVKRMVVYWTPNGRRESDAATIPPDMGGSVLDTILMRPIAVYLMLREVASSVRFIVETPAKRTQFEWKP